MWLKLTADWSVSLSAMTGSFVFCLLGVGVGGGGLTWHLDLWTIEEQTAAIEDKRIEVFGFFTQLEHLWMLWYQPDYSG